MKCSLKRSTALCTLLFLAGSVAAHAGLFHHKKKPLTQKDDALASVASNQPDKELFDRAMRALQKGQYTLARLDLQTLLNTYPDSEYQMRAKLAIGDTWYKEGGTAALQQAEEEYKDFITFFPDKPEAAEAQMKVADIYYKQMEKPDRDPTNALRAQDEYRTMILQYPDSSLIPQAKQKLREVQEVLGNHEFNIGSFYQTRMNYAAAIARLQSVIDTYPLYSQSDEALLLVGDAYAAEAKNTDRMKIDPAAKQRLHQLFTRRAANAYDRIVLEYPMAPHADDARDRLEAMNLPVPEPTRKQIASSAAIEQSRTPINLKYRAFLLFTARPSTEQASRVGEPSLISPPPIMAPAVIKDGQADMQWAIKPDGKPAPIVAGTLNVIAPGATAESIAASKTPAAQANGQTEAAGTTGLQLNDLSTGDNNVNGSTTPSNAVQPPAGSETSTAPVSGGQPIPGTATENGQPAVWPSAQKDNGGLQSVAPTNNTPLPAAQAAAPAPAQINDVSQGGQSMGQNTSQAGGKNAKPAFKSKEESSSTHKKKKGLRRLNPF